MPAPLPIDDVLPQVLDGLRQREALVLEAPPGAGKTTRVPAALLDAGLAGDKEVVVLQPRRLATRLAAARVAEERGERLGDVVGYQVRFDDVSSAKTRLRFVTEGLLTRRLVGAPRLPEVGCVVLDEFHERHLAGDLALAMLRRLQLTTRPDLKLVVMSATLDATPIAAWLGDAPRVRSEGRPFEVRVDYLERDDERPLEVQVLGALKRLVQAGLDGHVLVFLPGAAEIRRAMEACDDFARRQGLEVLALHGDLPAAEQDRAVRGGAKQKVILSTNVAETSVTIEGVAAVVDSGLARVASHSPWSGLPTLRLAKVSKASATQRAGRAGRTRAGACLRLYTRGDYEGRPAADAPEIRRVDLTEAALALRALGVEDTAAFPFFERPTEAALAAAESLLRRLGATDASGGLTAIGRRLLAFPTHPRLARLMLEAEVLGAGRDGATVAALLQERDVRLEARARFGGPGRGRDVQAGASDVLELLERFEAGRKSGARGAGLDASAVASVERVQRQLSRLLKAEAPAPKTRAEHEAALLRAVLAGYPDRVAKRRRPRAPDVVFASGGAGVIDATSVVHEAELLVAVDAEERRGTVTVRVASAVEPEWLLDAGAGELSERDALEWNASSQRVERVTRLAFGAVTLEERRQPAPASPGTTALLAEQARAAGPLAFIDAATLEAWACRVEALRAAFPAASFPADVEAFVAEALVGLCDGLRSFKEVADAGLLDALRARLTPQQASLLAREAPEHITLAGGRRVQVHYERGRPPWVESRLQDFFGSTRGPAIGQTPLVLHLLAPNMRAVQVTTDLTGFWERHYPALRRELMRRYPRHAWPEDPTTAQPTGPRRR